MPNMTQAGYTPPKPEIKKAPPAPKKKKHAKKKRAKKRISGVAAASMLIFLAAVLIGARTIYIYTQTQPYVNAYLAGTSLDNYPLGGATKEDGDVLLARMTADAVSSWRFEMTYEGQSWLVTAEDIGLQIDRDATLEPLWQLGREGNMVSRYLQMLSVRRNPVNVQPVIVYDMAPADALLERIAADVEREPSDASVTFVPQSSTPFHFVQEQCGLTLHVESLRAQIEQAVRGLTSVNMTLVPQEIEPDVSRSELESAIMLRTRLVMEIAADEASFTNAQLAARSLNGVRIEAGAALSLNESIGKRTEEAGYTVAPEPAYGMDVSGVGGGVCQVSTAMYRAALLGGLEIRERHAAARPVAYCAMGQEAAISEQGLDLVIQNPTAHPVFVASRVYREDEKAYIELQIIGEALEEKYALESETEETALIEEPVYVRDHEGKYARYTDERVPAGKALPGYRAKVFRVTLDEDGQETAREMISEDAYEAVPPAVYVGIEERPE